MAFLSHSAKTMASLSQRILTGHHMLFKSRCILRDTTIRTTHSPYLQHIEDESEILMHSQSPPHIEDQSEELEEAYEYNKMKSKLGGVAIAMSLKKGHWIPSPYAVDIKMKLLVPGVDSVSLGHESDKDMKGKDGNAEGKAVVEMFKEA